MSSADPTGTAARTTSGTGIGTAPAPAHSADVGLLSPGRAGSGAEAATGDDAFLRAMLDAEAALSRAQAAVGLTPLAASDAITAAALLEGAEGVDVRDLALRAARAGGDPVTPLVADLTAAVDDAEARTGESAGVGVGGGTDAGRYVHRGASGQDIVDTAMMLVAARTVPLILADLDRTADALAALATAHRTTPMAGRALTQHVAPTTFGLKAAGWLSAVRDARTRLAAVRLPVQLGGVAGTLAAFARPDETVTGTPGRTSSAASGEPVYDLTGALDSTLDTPPEPLPDRPPVAGKDPRIDPDAGPDPEAHAGTDSGAHPEVAAPAAVPESGAEDRAEAEAEARAEAGADTEPDGEPGSPAPAEPLYDLAGVEPSASADADDRTAGKDRPDVRHQAARPAPPEAPDVGAHPGGHPDTGVRLLAAYAAQLRLAEPTLPWHTLRTPVADLGSALALTAGTLGKLAADVLVLSRTEIGEVAEARGPGASGPPHRRDPVRATLIAAAARQAPALASVLLGALVAEDERPAGPWHAEWQPLRALLRLTGGAARDAAELAHGLRVFPDRMRANLGLTHGLLASERLTAALAPAVGAERARHVVGAAARLASGAGIPLAQALTETDPAVAELIGDARMRVLTDPAGYTGSAPALVDRALAAHAAAESARARATLTDPAPGSGPEPGTGPTPGA